MTKKHDKGSEDVRRLLFLDTSSENATEDEILEYLAAIILDMYLRQAGHPGLFTKDDDDLFHR